jgi:hypothetical protein
LLYAGENDVTVILRPSLGSRRWQHLQLGGNHPAVEDNYTIILGSHRNSRLKIEKNGDSVAEVCLGMGPVTALQ